MKILLPKLNREITAANASEVLEALNQASLLPAETMEEYKRELKGRLSAWFGESIATDDPEALVDLLAKANAVIILER